MKDINGLPIRPISEWEIMRGCQYDYTHGWVHPFFEQLNCMERYTYGSQTMLVMIWRAGDI